MVAEITADVILREDLLSCLEDFRNKKGPGILKTVQKLLGIVAVYFKVMTRVLGLNFVAWSLRWDSFLKRLF